MADRQAFPPPIKCSAKAKSTGQRCERWSVPGRLQCKLHGALGGPNAGRAAAIEGAGATLTLAQAMANNPGRPVWEVILDSIRTVDVLAQAARDEVAAGRVSSSDGIERVASLARCAHAMASSVMATKALEAYSQHAASWSNAVAARLSTLLMDWMGLPVALDGQVSRAITATLSTFDPSDTGKAPRPTGPPLLDLVGQAVAVALASRLGLPIEQTASWFAGLIRAVDAGRPVPDLPRAAVAALPAAPAPEPVPPPLPAASEVLTVNRQTAVDPEPAEVEPEPAVDVLEGELVDARPRRITTTLGRRSAEPFMPYGYRTFGG